MFVNKIFEDITNAWELDQCHPNRGRIHKPVPEKNHLRAVFETAFHASLKREEEKPIAFSLAILPREKFEEEQKQRKQMIMRFAPPIDLTPESLVKLAPAFSPKTTALVVQPKGEDRCEVWGAVAFKKSSSRFDEIPAAYRGYNFFRPDVMMITTVSAGVLRISRGDGIIGYFENGKISRATPDPFASNAMGSHIINCIANDVGYRTHQNNYWHIYRDSLNYLISETSSRGHGGTVIIIPDPLKGNYEGSILKRYPIEQDLQIEDLILKFLVPPNRVPESLIFSVLNCQLIAERLEILAQMACIDGALVLSSSFDLIAFGAQLNADVWNKKVLSGPDGFGGGGGEFKTAGLGTRHSSAINFIGNCSGVGFVISQDGPVRGFAKKDNGTVLCWSDCRLSMFV